MEILQVNRGTRGTEESGRDTHIFYAVLPACLACSIPSRNASRLGRVALFCPAYCIFLRLRRSLLEFSDRRGSCGTAPREVLVFWKANVGRCHRQTRPVFPVSSPPGAGRPGPEHNGRIIPAAIDVTRYSLVDRRKGPSADRDLRRYVWEFPP